MFSIADFEIDQGLACRGTIISLLGFSHWLRIHGLFTTQPVDL